MDLSHLITNSSSEEVSQDYSGVDFNGSLELKQRSKLSANASIFTPAKPRQMLVLMPNSEAEPAPEKKNKQVRQVKQISLQLNLIVADLARFFLENDIPILEHVKGKDVHKFSVYVGQGSQVQDILKSCLKKGVQIEAVSLPNAIDVYKRKRSFLVFFKIPNFEEHKQEILDIFEESEFKGSLIPANVKPQRIIHVMTKIEEVEAEEEDDCDKWTLL